MQNTEIAGIIYQCCKLNAKFLFIYAAKLKSQQTNLAVINLKQKENDLYA
jgi:hypothetical protein